MRLHCPRCRTVVDVAPGEKPACPACGFGAPAAPQYMECPQCRTVVEDTPGWSLVCPNCGYGAAATPAPPAPAPSAAYAPYPAYAPPPPRYLRNKELGWAVVATVALAAVLGLASSLTGGTTAVVVVKNDVVESSVDASLLAPFAGIAGVAAAALFLTWIYRVVRNGATFAPGPGAPRPGWALGSFFIPFAHVGLPYPQILKAWRASQPGAPSKEGLLLGWWLLWAAGVALLYVRVGGIAAWEASFVGSLLQGSHEVELPAWLVALDWLQSAFMVAAACLLAGVVVEFTRRQDAKAKELGLAA